MKSDTKIDPKALKQGIRRAHLAALYANFRQLLEWTKHQSDPAVGLHGVIITEAGRSYLVSAGATPRLQSLLSAIGSMQGFIISNAVAREYGDAKGAQLGDQFDPELGKTRCVGCEDGDPEGKHAAEELAENAKAWLGVIVDVANSFYAPHLSPRAKELIEQLKAEALPSNTKVS